MRKEERGRDSERRRRARGRGAKKRGSEGEGEAERLRGEGNLAGEDRVAAVDSDAVEVVTDQEGLAPKRQAERGDESSRVLDAHSRAQPHRCTGAYLRGERP